MSASILTFNELAQVETSTHTTIERVRVSGKRAVSPFRRLSLAFGLWTIDFRLTRLLRYLAVDLPPLQASDLKHLAHRAGQLHGRLNRLVNLLESETEDRYLLRGRLKSIRENNDHLGSIVEGLQLSTDEEFQSFIGCAVRELDKPRPERRSEHASV